MTTSDVEAIRTPALAAAPATAPRNIRTRAFRMSARFNTALAKVPRTNPAWTAIRQRILGVPVSVAEETEASFGTALLALHGGPP